MKTAVLVVPARAVVAAALLAALTGVVGGCNSGTSIQQDSINTTALREGAGTVTQRGSPTTRSGGDDASDPAGDPAGGGGGGGLGAIGDPTKAPARGSDDPANAGGSNDPSKNPSTKPPAGSPKPPKKTTAERQAAAKAELEQIKAARGKLLGLAAPKNSNRSAIAQQLTSLHNRAMRATAVAYPFDYARRQAALVDRYNNDMANLRRNN